PTADFSVSSNVSCLYNNSTTFTNLSTTDGTHPIIKWQWNYGDGTIDSTGVSPYQHSYGAAGNYTVSLVVSDSYGCTDISSRPAAVIISQPDADFNSPDTITCTGRPITFTNTSAGAGLQYAWNFGDGNASTVTNPIHNYATIGTFTIGLVVTDQYGCIDSVTRPDYISISYPRARFTISDSVSTCPPLLVNFAHQSTDYTSLTWNFGDGTTSSLDSPSHFYTTAGTFNAILTVTGPGGCTDTAMKQIVISGPSGSFSYTPLTGCKPLTVNFTGIAQNNATYTWDFADGTIVVTTDSLISHTYTNAGEFVPKLILTDAGGCSVPITGSDTIRVTGITAGFTVGSSTFCNDGNVQFTNTTVGNDFITSYQWSFGDGTGSTAQHPAHYYTSPGIYTVSLLAISQTGCRDSLSFVDTIKIHANPIITIQHDPSGCVPLTVNYTGQVNLGDPATLKWLWNFGNGATDILQNPVAQIYTLANAYTANATVTDLNGCKDTATVQINAYPIPVVDAGANAFVCAGSATQLTAAGATTYSWNPAASLSCTTCSSPLAAPADTTVYFVTGTTQFGCSASDSVTIGVHHPFVLQVADGDTVCSGTPVHLRATGADGYIWSPSIAVTNPAVGITTATPTNTTLYQVIASDRHNCFTDTGYVNILVWQYPSVNAGTDKTISIGTSVTLQPTYSSDITSYQWTNPMQSLSCTTCPTPTLQMKTAVNTFSIRVRNDGGCEASDEITIHAICNGANLFIPNTFSPNSDGKNEKFYLRGSGLNTIKSLRIYNRWGEIVFTATNFEANDASAGWDGMYKGKALPPDVYVYTCEVICQNNEILTYHGNVTLLR
ncbi:MAG TPA: PKD domain-containing protein, partial [Flavisolibacter sp.]